MVDSSVPQFPHLQLGLSLSIPVRVTLGNLYEEPHSGAGPGRHLESPRVTFSLPTLALLRGAILGQRRLRS